MHLAYLDDSRDEKLVVATALVTPADPWNQSFAAVHSWRRALKSSEGIFVYKDLRATALSLAGERYPGASLRWGKLPSHESRNSDR